MHARGRGVDDDVEARLGQLLAFEGLGLGLTRQFLRRLGGAIQDEYFRALVLEPEDSGTRRASCTHDQNLRALQLQAPLQRADDAGDIGVEAVELALLRADDRIAGADLLGQGIGLLQVLRESLP